MNEITIQQVEVNRYCDIEECEDIAAHFISIGSVETLICTLCLEALGVAIKEHLDFLEE